MTSASFQEGRPYVAVPLLRALATAVAMTLGFSAISDDDFARIVIAQGFAEDASWDPSGSSWLPFPFWLTGAVMKLFGSSVNVARGLALCTSIGSALLVYVGARWCGLPVKKAWIGASIAGVLPHAVWLGAATVPEGFTAALCLLALASLTTRRPHRRWLGAIAVTCAALSRYEAWPVAAFVFGFGVFDVTVERRARLLGPALFALLGPIAWLVHGAINHDDALFFVKRVAAYRRSLGRSPETLLMGLLGYPKVLLRAEPELMAASVLLFFKPVWRRLPPNFVRILLGAACVFVFLIIGDLRDGAPTHHPERPLLTVWLVLCVAVGHALVELWPERRRLLLLAAAAAVGLFALRPMITRRDSFIDRSQEIAIGKESRPIVARGKVLVDSEDYGFFAIMAGFERVSQTEALVHHDPRIENVDPWSSRAALSARLRGSGASFIVVDRAKLPRLEGLGRAVKTTERYALFELAPNAARTTP